MKVIKSKSAVWEALAALVLLIGMFTALGYLAHLIFTGRAT